VNWDQGSEAKTLYRDEMEITLYRDEIEIYHSKLSRATIIRRVIGRVEAAKILTQKHFAAGGFNPRLIWSALTCQRFGLRRLDDATLS